MYDPYVSQLRLYEDISASITLFSPRGIYLLRLYYNYIAFLFLFLPPNLIYSLALSQIVEDGTRGFAHTASILPQLGYYDLINKCLP